MNGSLTSTTPWPVLETLVLIAILGIAVLLYRQISRSRPPAAKGIAEATRLAGRISALERQRTRDLSDQVELRQLLKRHLEQSLKLREHIRALQAHISSVESRSRRSDAMRLAIELARNGQSLEEQVRQGALTAAEARLIQSIHRPKPLKRQSA